MKSLGRSLLSAAAFMVMTMGVAHADKYNDTVDVFKQAMESRNFFHHSYGYAVFPNVGEGGFVVGAALGKGRVYAHGVLVGDATMKQLSAGFQAGGKVYSQIIFFKDRRSSAVAITAGASASAATDGTSHSGSLTENDAAVGGHWNNGMAVFTVAKGGLMYAATIAGQKFTYKNRGEG